MAEPRFTKMGRYGDAMLIEPQAPSLTGDIVARIIVNGSPIHLDRVECREIIELLQTAVEQ